MTGLAEDEEVDLPSVVNRIAMAVLALPLVLPLKALALTVSRYSVPVFRAATGSMVRTLPLELMDAE